MRAACLRRTALSCPWPISYPSPTASIAGLSCDRSTTDAPVIHHKSIRMKTPRNRNHISTSIAAAEFGAEFRKREGELTGRISDIIGDAARGSRHHCDTDVLQCIYMRFL